MAWEMGNGKWEVGNGKWAWGMGVGNGRGKCVCVVNSQMAHEQVLVCQVQPFSTGKGCSLCARYAARLEVRGSAE